METSKNRIEKPNSCDQSLLRFLPSELIFEVLQWLPAKSLMRFKTVCKSWHYLIRDLDFAEAHYLFSQAIRPADSSHLLILVTNHNNSVAKTIFPAKPDGVISNRLPMYNFDLNYGVNCSNIVNGLICLSKSVFYKPNHENHIELLNLTTKEKLSLPTLPSALTCSCAIRCFLGFDPIDKLYKVLVFFGLPKRFFIITLSVGNRDADISSSSWRGIRGFPHMDVTKLKHVYADGEIFWNVPGVVVNYFGFREERFRSFCIHDKVPCPIMTEVEGKFSFVTLETQYIGKRDVCKITLWKLMNKDGLIWVSDTIKLPGELLWRKRRISVIGSTNTGYKLLITSKCDSTLDMLIFCDVFCEVGKKKKNCEIKQLMFEDSNVANQLFSTLLSKEGEIDVIHHVENILPMNIRPGQKKAD
ncbi:OLC1v1005839C1 [Oldenlandia corymbosa var. corymbosa]|uniref:OLC1v1005839C1 n=1 Tax=Oldenlandia corymbosa var. corymbosa TaxID=529605 RepID=A0AAV1DGU4_OLDCO|nr:OLC1v1005839C1 [Oldenlandia corymbosa var. corymbosa]